MTDVLAFVNLISLVALVIGLWRPEIVVRWGSGQTRGRAVATYGSAFFLSAILLAALSDDASSPSNDPASESEQGDPGPIVVEIELQEQIDGGEWRDSAGHSAWISLRDAAREHPGDPVRLSVQYRGVRASSWERVGGLKAGKEYSQRVIASFMDDALPEPEPLFEDSDYFMAQALLVVDADEAAPFGDPPSVTDQQKESLRLKVVTAVEDAIAAVQTEGNQE